MKPLWLSFLLSSIFWIVGCQTPVYQESGWASYIADAYAGRMTSSGQPYYPQYYTAAHNRLPFGTEITVKNLYTGSSVKAVVTDRFPAYPGRVVNLSGAAASAIGVAPMRLAQVQITAYRIPQQGYPQQTYPQQNYAQQPYPQQSYPAQNYAQQQPYTPQQAYPQQTYAQPTPTTPAPAYPNAYTAPAAPKTTAAAPTYRPPTTPAPAPVTTPRPSTPAPVPANPAPQQPSFFSRRPATGTPSAPVFQGNGGPPPGLQTF